MSLPRVEVAAPAAKSAAGIAVGVTFVTLGLTYGVWYSYSVFLVALLREFGWSRSVVAGAFSIFVMVHGMSGPALGWLVERLGPRRVIMAGAGLIAAGLLLAAETHAPWHLYLSFGVVAAVGVSSAGWVPSVVLVRAWFPSRIGTALGIASSGIGVGIFALVPLSQLLIDQVGWRWALRVLALLVAGWAIPATGLLLRDLTPPGTPGRELARPDPAAPPPRQPAPREPAVPVAPRYWTVALAFRSWRFWTVSGVFLTGSFATQTLLVHQVAFLVDHGIPALAAAGVVGVVGLSSVVGKTGWGILSDRFGRELAYTLAFACVLASVGVLAAAGAWPGPALPYVYGVLIGIGYASTAPLTPAVASDLFGGPRFPRIFGVLHAATSIGGAIGAWIAGVIFDATGGYAVALWVVAFTAVCAPALLWLAAPRRPNLPPA
jgi:MFS family permease